jgi:hypothetical protein
MFPEFEAEQDYMKTLSYLSPEEQKKHAARQAIAFMYQKPPGIDIVERKAAAQVSLHKQRNADATKAACCL